MLIVAYDWPPAGGPGVQRWLKFAKHLPDHGWRPTLLVPDGAAYPVLDPSLETEVSADVEVLRVPIFEPYEAALSLVRRKGAERLGSGNRKSGPVDRLVRWVRGNVLRPTPGCSAQASRPRGPSSPPSGGSRRAALQGHDHPGPPHSVHLIGLDLRKAPACPGSPTSGTRGGRWITSKTSCPPPGPAGGTCKWRVRSWPPVTWPS